MDWPGLYQLFMGALSGAWTYFCELLGFVFVFSLAELARPNGPRPRNASVLFNLSVTLLLVSLGAATGAVMVDGFAASALRRAGGPLASLARSEDVTAQLGLTLLFLLVFDFFYYWFHRLQHTRLLWWQHRVHHADEALSATTTFRHHWSESSLRALLLWLPMNLLIHIPPMTLGAVVALVTGWGFFIHANLRLGLGPLTPVVAGPMYHRIHHSSAVEHRDRNFAAYFPLWDLLFGTYVRPTTGAAPETGLGDGQRLVEDWRSVLLCPRPIRVAADRGREGPLAPDQPIADSPVLAGWSEERSGA